MNWIVSFGELDCSLGGLDCSLGGLDCSLGWIALWIGLLRSQRNQPRRRPPHIAGPTCTDSKGGNESAAPRTTVLHDLPTRGASSTLAAALSVIAGYASAKPAR